MKSLYCFLGGLFLGILFIIVFPNHAGSNKKTSSYEAHSTNNIQITNISINSNGEYVYTVMKY